MGLLADASTDHAVLAATVPVLLTLFACFTVAFACGAYLVHLWQHRHDRR